jgi:hypothetical protein
MTTLLTAEEVLTIAEQKADQASTEYMRKQAAVIGATYISDLADFRHAVRYAATGAVLHIAGCMAQTDHYPCVAQLTDGTRLYEAHVHPGIDADEWDSIVD